jgi:hypothetical protein
MKNGTNHSDAARTRINALPNFVNGTTDPGNSSPLYKGFEVNSGATAVNKSRGETNVTDNAGEGVALNTKATTNETNLFRKVPNASLSATTLPSSGNRTTNVAGAGPVRSDLPNNGSMKDNENSATKNTVNASLSSFALLPGMNGSTNAVNARPTPEVVG